MPYTDQITEIVPKVSTFSELPFSKCNKIYLYNSVILLFIYVYEVSDINVHYTLYSIKPEK